MYARDVSLRSYPESGVKTPNHPSSHHGEDPKRIDGFSKINQYHVKMLAHFVDRLAKTPDGQGTLLDHSMVLYGTNMGNPNQHLHYDVPHVIVGGVNGKFKGGRHLAYPERTPMTNLLVSMLGKSGIQTDRLGDNNGTVDL